MNRHDCSALGDMNQHIFLGHPAKHASAAFEPYSRSIGIDELILALYSNGISTRNSAEIMHAIFLDSLFFFLRRDTVEKEPVIFSMCSEKGEYEIPRFYLSPKETQHIFHSNRGSL